MKEIKKLIEELSFSYGKWEVFQDLIKIMAITIRNNVDKHNCQERENEYLETISKYSKDEVYKFSELYSLIVAELEKGFNDVLGQMYMELGIGDKWKGQFFTPYETARLMAELAFGDKHKEIIKEKGFIIANDEAVGAGATLIALADVMKSKGFNPQKQLFIQCGDLDIKSVYMCYIQLSLYGIPAIVEHKDSLSDEVWERWPTPFYILGGWYRKNKQINSTSFEIDKEI